MQCLFALAIFAMLRTSLGSEIKNKTKHILPNDHIVEHYIEKTIKNLLYFLEDSANHGINITENKINNDGEQVPKSIHREQCKGALRNNLIRCFNETTDSEDLECVRNYWKPNSDFPHLDILLGPSDVDDLTDVPLCVKYCMKWARGSLTINCNWQEDKLRLERAERYQKYRKSHNDKDKENSYFIFYKNERSPHNQDRTEESLETELSNQEDVSDLEGDEALKVLCAWLAVDTLDSCLEEIVAMEDLEQLRTYWTAMNTQLIMKLFASPEYNEFEDVSKDIKKCMVQAKQDFTQCRMLGNHSKSSEEKLFTDAETEM